MSNNAQKIDKDKPPEVPPELMGRGKIALSQMAADEDKEVDRVIKPDTPYVPPAVEVTTRVTSAGPLVVAPKGPKALKLTAKQKARLRYLKTAKKKMDAELARLNGQPEPEEADEVPFAAQTRAEMAPPAILTPPAPQIAPAAKETPGNGYYPHGAVRVMMSYEDDDGNVVRKRGNVALQPGQPYYGLTREQVLEINARMYPDEPKRAPMLGDMTPDFIAWIKMFHPADAAVRYYGRGI